jgi:Ca2+-binding EF-hand superfamily protein
MGWVSDDKNDILCPIDIGVGERLNDHEIAAMIQEADEDGNGEISFPGELNLSFGFLDR